MKKLIFPLINKEVYISTNSDSFLNRDYSICTEIPTGNHVGAFGVRRKYHSHEGVDLYCMEGDPVVSMEDGVITLIEPFTGEQVGCPWWNNTNAVHIEGKSGVIVYGEIQEISTIKTGQQIKKGELIGHVKTVLKKNKGRPMTMLHIELYEHGSRGSVEWIPPESPQPTGLMNPTELLIKSLT